MKGFPDLPPVWAAGAAASSWLLAQVLPLATWPGGTGHVFMAAGLALIAWSAWWFHKKQTPIMPHEEPQALIVEGPYRINRNPIYSGLVLVVAGFAIMLGALSALLPAILLPFVIHHRFVLKEEAALRRRFGAEAEAYLRRTRRW